MLFLEEVRSTVSLLYRCSPKHDETEDSVTSNTNNKKFKHAFQFWRLPARSPDLNPVEQFWAYLRKHLRAMDLKDATAKKPTLGKMAYTARIRAVMKSKKAQDMASRCALGLKKTCRLVVKNKGAAVPR